MKPDSRITPTLSTVGICFNAKPLKLNPRKAQQSHSKCLQRVCAKAIKNGMGEKAGRTLCCANSSMKGSSMKGPMLDHIMAKMNDGGSDPECVGGQLR